jgi:hypothetical protein
MSGISAFGKFKRWLLQESDEPRRAPRRAQPELVVYYWDGSAPDGRHIRDISQSGAYIYTTERWYPGTIIRIILQGQKTTVESDGTTKPVSSICIPARVIRHGDDGVAVEFAFRDKEEEDAFLKFLVKIPAQPVRSSVAVEVSHEKG